MHFFSDFSRPFWEKRGDFMTKERNSVYEEERGLRLNTKACITSALALSPGIHTVVSLQGVYPKAAAITCYVWGFGWLPCGARTTTCLLEQPTMFVKRHSHLLVILPTVASIFLSLCLWRTNRLTGVNRNVDNIILHPVRELSLLHACPPQFKSYHDHLPCVCTRHNLCSQVFWQFFVSKTDGVQVRSLQE